MDQLEKSTKLRAWFASNGGKIHDAVEITASESNGYSLHVREGQKLPPESQVISCPHNLTISVMDMEWASHSWPELFMSRYRSNPEVLTRFFLMEQYLKGTQSFWWPYIQMLPQPRQAGLLHTPMFYEESDCVWIRGTNLDGSRVAREVAWQKEFYQGLGILSSGGGNLRPLASQYDWNVYKWAATILTSRCFPGSALSNRFIPEDDPNVVAKRSIVRKWTEDASTSFPVLLPVFDLANHNPSAKVSWEWNPSDCAFVVDREITEGTQIWNNYGPKGNEELVMGYGFSLFSNKADAFALALSSYNSVNLIKVKERQRGIFSQLTKSAIPDEDMLSINNISSKGNPSPKATGEADSSYTNLSNPVAIKSNSEIFHIRLITESPFLSLNQALLDTLSIMVANTRELKNIQITPARFWIPRPPNDMTHNKTTTACQLLKALHYQYTKITDHSAKLPLWPQNEKQFHAARYRRSQLHILDSAIKALTKELTTATIGFDRYYFVDLRTILTSTPSPLRGYFCAAIHHTLHTRNAKKLREAGYEDLVFTIWICSLYLYYDSPASSPLAMNHPTSSFQQRILCWIDFINISYGAPSGWNHEAPINITNDESESGSETDDETNAIALSYLPVIVAAAEEYPDSLYADKRWTAPFLAWGYTIFQEESVLVPSLLLKDPKSDEVAGGDTLMLFLETLPGKLA